MDGARKASVRALISQISICCVYRSTSNEWQWNHMLWALISYRLYGTTVQNCKLLYILMKGLSREKKYCTALNIQLNITHYMSYTIYNSNCIVSGVSETNESRSKLIKERNKLRRQYRLAQCIANTILSFKVSSEVGSRARTIPSLRQIGS